MYTVIYDGNCNLCVSLVRLLEKLDQGQRFCYVPMQDEKTLTKFGVTAEECRLGMILIEQGDSQRASLQRWQGSEAAEEIGRLLPMGEIFVQAYRAMPGLKAVGDRGYEFIRDNRYDLFGKRAATYQPRYPACPDGNCQWPGEADERLGQ